MRYYYHYQNEEKTIVGVDVAVFVVSLRCDPHVRAAMHLTDNVRQRNVRLCK